VLGQNVRVLSLNQRGIVIEVPQDLANNAASLVGVRCGAMKIRVPAADLEIVGREKRAEDSTRAGSHFKAQRGATRGDRFDRSSGGARNLPSSVSASRDLDVFVRTSANTLDLRGKRVDDALADLERFMDESSVSSTSPVMIIHGHGTGAVRQAVRDYLGSNYAKSFKSGEHYEGGDGVTIVQL
jgi:DNA mismatch repair protein MutS2